MTSNRRLIFPALIAAGVLWGTTVPLSKVALGWMPPAWLAFVRFAFAAVILIAASRSRLRAACSPAILISGGLGYGGSVLLQNLGIERTSVTHAALLIGATPVLVAIIAAALRHSVARPVAWAGFALSLAGVGFIASGQGAGSTLAGDGLVLVAQLVSAGFTVSQARLLRGRDPVAVTGLQLLSAAVLVLPVALATDHHLAGPAGPAALLATIGLVLAGTVGPTALFAFGQSKVAADVAGAFLNIEPLVGAAMGMALFADPLGPVQVAGGVAIMAGIGLSSYQVVRSERRRKAVLSPASDPVASRLGPAEVRLGPAEAGVSADGALASLPGPGEAPSLVTRSRFVRMRGNAAASLAGRGRPDGHLNRRATAGGSQPGAGRLSGAGRHSGAGRQPGDARRTAPRRPGTKRRTGSGRGLADGRPPGRQTGRRPHRAAGARIPARQEARRVRPRAPGCAQALRSSRLAE